MGNPLSFVSSVSFATPFLSSVSLENRGVTISKWDTTKEWSGKADTTDKTQGVRAKTKSPGENESKKGKKISNNTQENKQNNDQSNKNKWCEHHKYNATHVTKECRNLKNKKKMAK